MAKGTVRNGIHLVQTSFEMPWNLQRSIDKALDKLKDEYGRVISKRQLLSWLIEEFFKDENAQERFRLWLAVKYAEEGNGSADEQ